MEIKPHAHRPVLNPCTLEGRNYQVDPYIGCGHYCYYCYVLNQAETDWTKEVWYHENFAGRLEEAISGIQPQSIYMCRNMSIDIKECSPTEFNEFSKITVSTSNLGRSNEKKHLNRQVSPQIHI